MLTDSQEEIRLARFQRADRGCFGWGFCGRLVEEEADIEIGEQARGVRKVVVINVDAIS